MIKIPEGMLNIATYVPRSMIYGPGERFVIWVQGCGLGCQGCWNEEMQPFVIKRIINTKELFRQINNEPGLEGITILGGEPLHQSRELLTLVRMVQNTGLTVLLYTGFEMNEINDDKAIELIEISDIVIPGRYISEKRNIGLKWRGSSNQKIIFHNTRYIKKYSQIDEENEVEIHIDENGDIRILGYPEKELIKGVLNG